MRCDDCGLPRTFHRGKLFCAVTTAGLDSQFPPACPTCGEEALEAIGAGTERVEETFQELFPSVSVGVLDRDASRRRGEAAAVLERFANGETQVLIGTQMVSKGHHFPTGCAGRRAAWPTPTWAFRTSGPWKGPTTCSPS